MKKHEFDSLKIGQGMRAFHNNQWKQILSVDFINNEMLLKNEFGFDFWVNYKEILNVK